MILDAVILCSTGFGAVYPIITVTSYNQMTDEVRGFIISDLGAFDHFALIGVPSQIEHQHHPLLIQVLAVERSMEVMTGDLEFFNNHTVAEHVRLDRSYTEKVAEYRAWWAGWQSRLFMVKQAAEFLLAQLGHIDEWLPPYRVEQYCLATIRIHSRLQRVVASCISAEMLGKAISYRLSAWQDAVRKTSLS